MGAHSRPLLLGLVAATLLVVYISFPSQGSDPSLDVPPAVSRSAPVVATGAADDSSDGSRVADQTVSAEDDGRPKSEQGKSRLALSTGKVDDSNHGRQQERGKPSSPSSTSEGANVNHLEAAEAALASCRKWTDGKQCALLRGAVVTNKDTILVPRQSNPAFAKQFPSGSGPYPVSQTRHESRYHMRRPRVVLVDDDDPQLTEVPLHRETVGFYQTPIIGAMFHNVWHTLSDQYYIFHHTVQDLVERRVPLTWVSEPPNVVLRSKACATLAECRRLPLFTPFDQLFGGRVFFAREGFAGGAASMRFELLLLGLNTRCSPAPTEGLDVPVCQQALRSMRKSLLEPLGLADSRRVAAAELQCPVVHVMSRQRDRYRRMTPFDELLDELRDSYTERRCSPDRVVVYALSGRTSFQEQVEAIANSTVLLAGRGGGTGYSPLLPIGGGYLSVSGSDQWSPYRGLVPEWITMQHHTVQMVHHDDARRPPQKFYKPPIVDANRVGYLVKPRDVVAAFWQLVGAMRAVAASAQGRD